MKWVNGWQLDINFGKCRTIHFGHNTLHLNDIYSLISDNEKFWGVYIGNQFSFCQHEYNVIDKAKTY